MRIWISSVLLTILVVSGLSFPHTNDHEYKIPTVGTGQRSQYYVLHKDGTFKYGFDTGDGAFESVKSDTLGSLDGTFGYVDPDGNTIKLEYEAGRGGFVARGNHLPKPSPELAQALAAVVQRSEPFVDPLAGGDSDASYGFKFQSDDHSRTEEADSDGTVTGSYSYTDENGVVRRFTYKAGKGIGFVIEGDGLTVPIETPARSSIHRPSIKTNLPSRPITPDFKQSATYSGNQATIFSTRSEVPRSPAYSFSYNADDHSRREVSDDNLNVEGSFSFIANDGQRRTLNYEAGSGTGFVAQGEHLPVAPEFTFGDRLSHGTKSSQAQRVSVKSSQQDGQKKHVDRASTASAQGQRFSQSVKQTNPRQSGSSQSYKRPQLPETGTDAIHRSRGQTSASSKSGGIRSSQSNQQHKTGSVRAPVSHSSTSPKIGQQALTKVPPNGQSRTVGVGIKTTQEKKTSSDYKAGQQITSQGLRSSSESKTAQHITSQGQITSADYITGYQTATKQSGSHQHKVGASQSPKLSIQDSSAIQNAFTRSSTSLKSSPVSRQHELANIRSSSSPDGSYSFSYDTSSHSRSESGDAKNNVVGEFEFVADDDGEKRKIIYEAGSATGFIAEGEHIPVGPIVPGAPSGQPTGRIVPVVEVPFVDPLADSDSDASYNFKFDSETYSRSETADEDGNIVGTYTVVDDDGTRVTYRFRAGKGIGFETEEISRTKGPKPVKPIPYSGPLASDIPATLTNAGHSSLAQTFSTGSEFKTDTSFGIRRVDPPLIPSSAQGVQSTRTSGLATKSQGTVVSGPISRNAIKTSQQTTSVGSTASEARITDTGGISRTEHRTSVSSNLNGASIGTATRDTSKDTAYKSGSQNASSKFTGSSASSSRIGATSHFLPTKVDLKSAFQPTHTQQVFPGFKLFSYAPSPTAEKFGYVLKFDN